MRSRERMHVAHAGAPAAAAAAPGARIRRKR